MKKLVLLLFIISVFSFGTKFQTLFKGNTAIGYQKILLLHKWKVQKIVTLYKDNEKVVYVFGVEGKNQK